MKFHAVARESSGFGRDGIAPLMGASLLSAAGSLPLHLMPLIVVALIAEARVSVAAAGWVTAALFLGQLAASLTLPALKVDRVGRRFMIAAAFVLAAALVLAAVDGLALLLAGWALVGACCGLLQYVGTVTAAGHVRPVFAFSLRLGVVLVLAGSVAGFLQAADVLTSYGAIVTALCLIFAFVLGAGIALYRPGRAAPSARAAAPACPPPVQFGGLASGFLLMVGQIGFLAYAVQGAVAHGIALADAAWAVAGMKCGAGIALLSIAHKGLDDKRRPRFLELGLLLAAGIVAVSCARTPAMFFLGLLVFEVALDFLSARLQGKVAETAPQFAGRWLTGTLLFGAAVGPILHGALLGADAGAWFLAFAIGTALVPALWTRLRRVPPARA